MEKISVAIRVRPPSKAVSPAPATRGHRWSIGRHNVALCNTLGTPINGQNYSFDHVFGTEATNWDIYKGLTKDVIMSSLSGFNGTVFAYGQTSSGKTYTMKGTPNDPGIIRLGVHDVFSHIRQLTNIREFLIRVSYMEIYNEDINDLFSPDNRRLRIHENLEKGIFVAGLREEIVDSPQQVFDLLEFGESHRHFGETNMNLYSSRSHTIFRMVIESRGTSPDGSEVDAPRDAVRVSCLNMVDLAGSERIAKTGAGGVRLKEGMHINKSLMTLGTVINKLSDGSAKHGGHIPYRDSKLTRILQPALGGNAKTAMICTVTPDEIHVDETRGTLQFASRAKRVSTCAQVNEIVTDAALLKRQTKEIEDLRMKLQGLPQSAHLEKEILNLRNELLKFELEKERLYLELQEEKRAQVDRERRIREQEQKIENLSTLFMSSTLDGRDVEKLHRKVNRRGTWCPRQFSEIAVQDFQRENDQVEDDETMDTILYSMRRDRNLTLPPAFEIDEEVDPFFTGSNEITDPEPPSDFENVADEDTWMSLNKGHTTTSTAFMPGFSERSRSSAGSGAAQKVAFLEGQLKDRELQYNDLQCSYDVKIEQTTKILREELETMKCELRKVQNENLNLKKALGAQFESQRELQCALDDLEFETDAARLLTGSMQGILADSLHVQAKILVTIQDCMAVTSSKGKTTHRLSSGCLGPRAKEKRILVENSVQKCREICAEVEHVLQDRTSRMQESVIQSYEETARTGTKFGDSTDNVDNLEVIHTSDALDVQKCRDLCAEVEHVVQGTFCGQGIVLESSLDVAKVDTASRALQENVDDLAVMHSNEDLRVKGPEKNQTSDPRGPPSNMTSSVTHVHKYCEGCLSSLLAGSRILSNEEVVLANDTELLSRQDNSGAGISTGRMTSLQSFEDANKISESERRSAGHSADAVMDPPACVSLSGFREHALRVLASHYDLCPEHIACNVHTADERADLADVWRGFSSCQHVGCSFGTLGRNCETCSQQESSILGKNEIPRAMNDLCSGILKLLEPSFPVLGAVRMLDDSEVTQNGKLKSRLASAKLLATWLLEEVQAIVQHDVNCLRRHVEERGNVGLLLEAIQILLLQIANFAVALLQATCQDEDIMKNLLEQMSALKDIHNTVQSRTKGMQPMDSVSERFEQGDANAMHVELSTKDRTSAGKQLANVGGSTMSSLSISLERVLKVEGVEEMLGRELNYIMFLLLSSDHRVRDGFQMFSVLTLAPKASQKLAKLLLYERQGRPRKIEQLQSDTWVSNSGTNTKQDQGESEQLTSQHAKDYNFAPNVTKMGSVSLETECASSGATELQLACGNESMACGDHELVDVGLCEDHGHIGSSDQLVGTTTESQQNLAAQVLLKSERVQELEIHLAGAELEVVELKIELEDLRSRMQTTCDTPENHAAEQLQSELQTYKNKCERYEEEIRLILEQCPSPVEDIQKDRQLKEIMEENQFLQGCLAKAKKHVLRSKAWRDEIRNWKDVERARRDTATDTEVASVHDVRASCNKALLESKIESEGPSSGGLNWEVPKCVQKNQGNLKDNSRLARPVLGLLDVNVRNGTVIGARTNPQRRRQLRFSGGENCIEGMFQI